MNRYYCLILLVLCALAGCGEPQPYVTRERLERGLLIVLPGVEGRSPFNEAICKGLNEGGVSWAIELRDWTSMWGPLYNQRAEGENRQKARQVADRIVRYRMAHPDRPVVLVGQSGGGAMAVWAAEALPPGQQIEGVIMLNPSLSPPYMLDLALERCRRGIVNFYSLEDRLFLGAGTTVAGTMDGRHSQSAGRVGFRIPRAGGTPKSYQRLFQVAWQPKMAATGHRGGHLTSGAEDFVAVYVAPFLLHEEWNEAFVGRVMNRELPAAPEADMGLPLTTQPAVELPPASTTAPAVPPATAPATQPATAPPVTPWPPAGQDPAFRGDGADGRSPVP